MLSDEYFADLSIAYRQEIRELYSLGCRACALNYFRQCKFSNFIAGHIQFDDPTFCYFCDENMISGMERSGVDHEALLDAYISAINLITQGRPTNLTVSVHMCRGNYKVCQT